MTSASEATPLSTTAAASSAAGVTPPKRGLGELPVHLALLAVGIAVSTPIVIAFFISFTPLKELVTRPIPQVLPDTWTLENYGTAWNASPFGRYMFNSFVQTGIITAPRWSSASWPVTPSPCSISVAKRRCSDW